MFFQKLKIIVGAAENRSVLPICWSALPFVEIKHICLLIVVCFLVAFSQFFHFSSCLSAGVEAGGLPGRQERPDQPNGCSNRQFVRVSSGHIQHRYRPVRCRCPQQQLLLRTDQEHLWSSTYVVTKQKKTKTTLSANRSEWSNMLCVCLSSCSRWRVRYSHGRSVWSGCAATSRQPLQAIRSGHHHTEHRLLLW